MTSLCGLLMCSTFSPMSIYFYHQNKCATRKWTLFSQAPREAQMGWEHTAQLPLLAPGLPWQQQRAPAKAACFGTLYATPPPSDHLQLIKEDTLSWWQRKHSERTSWLCPCKVGSIQSSSLGVHKPLCKEVAVVVTPGGWGNGHSERPWQCPSSCLRTSALSAQQAPPLQVPTAHVNLQVGRTKSPSMRTRNLVHQFQKEFWAGAGLSVMPPPQ